MRHQDSISAVNRLSTAERLRNGGKYSAYTPRLDSPRAPPIDSPRAAQEAAESATEYYGQYLRSGWDVDCFRYPRTARPQGAVEFCEVTRSSLAASANLQLAGSFTVSAGMAGRLLWIGGSEIVSGPNAEVLFCGFDLSWELRVGRQRNARAKRPAFVNRWNAPIGQVSRPMEITYDLADGTVVELWVLVPAGAARIICTKIQGWTASYTGGGPFNSAMSGR